VDSATARLAGELLESMLLVPILRPMLAGSGLLGDYELDMLSREIAARDQHGFAELIASRLERS
jgi:hypothetical protein